MFIFKRKIIANTAIASLMVMIGIYLGNTVAKAQEKITTHIPHPQLSQREITEIKNQS